jgi:hypothetical protein
MTAGLAVSRNRSPLALRPFPFRNRSRLQHLGGRFLRRTHRVEALFQRVHQIDDRRRGRREGRHDLLAGNLRLDNLSQPFTIFVRELGEVERLIEHLDHLLRELNFFRPHLRRHRVQFVSTILSGCF